MGAFSDAFSNAFDVGQAMPSGPFRSIASQLFQPGSIAGQVAERDAASQIVDQNQQGEIWE